MIKLPESFAAPGKRLLLRRLASVRVWPSRENFPLCQRLRIAPNSLRAVATSAKVHAVCVTAVGHNGEPGARNVDRPSMSDLSVQSTRVYAADSNQAALKLDEFLPYRLNVCSSLVTQALSRIYAERYRMSVAEWRVLVTLGEFGMMTAKAIGSHSHMHKTKVSRAVAQLERRKLVSRRANRADLREAFLSLTPSGHAVYSELAPAAFEFERQLMETMDLSERAALDRALTKLIERSEQLSAGVITLPAPR
jgi:DNA-binding MarR family transcriptional regulator